ncbi:SPOR domain-containing protein [Dysgonomonas sp. 521]|uniref:HU domain-containing protein n=1 Tax=Dysgonomonas sp. 521 TaxID=2302932 RepID=UPI0013D75EED|nr:SPOR domain-containing protein [Dysgonomonas sp. 521]NDV94406.1 SPOR domain-containing protein [Dysgonomonas sp. 521]
MENKVFTYLEFALPIHNCVIIPELGGFIINREETSSTFGTRIQVPGFDVVFNPDIRHDDGIITSYYKKDENLPYNVALQRIKDFVKMLKQELSAHKTVEIGKLGKLSVNEDGKIGFEAKQSFILPDFYGLTSVELNSLAGIIQSNEVQRKSFPVRYIAGSVAAAVAALLLFVVPSTTVNDNIGVKNVQQSGFVYSLTNKPIVEPTQEVVPDVENTETEEAPLRTYHIIVGGEDNKMHAQRLLKKMKSGGWNNVDIVESGGRYRISVASFSDKTEAESYLETFRKENPKYETAWLYSQRN